MAMDSVDNTPPATDATGRPEAQPHSTYARTNGAEGSVALQIQPVQFDTLAFFEALATSARAHPDQYRRLGMTDIVLGVKVGAKAYRLVFEDYECTEVTTYEPSSHVDCELEASREDWGELIEHLAARGRAGSAHTLNSLVLASDRFHLTGEDQLGVDKFYRYNATLQLFFEEAANVPLLPG